MGEPPLSVDRFQVMLAELLAGVAVAPVGGLGAVAALAQVMFRYGVVAVPPELWSQE